MPQTNVHEFIVDLYDAAVDISRWHSLGARLAVVLGGQTSAIWLEDKNQIYDLVTTVPAEALAVYQQYYHTCDPYAKEAARQPRMTALLGQELVPPQVVYTSEYYHDYSVPFGICHVVGATAPLYTNTSAMLVIAVHRPRDAQAFTNIERQRLNILLPHLQRAVQLRQRLGILEAQVQTGFAVFDFLAMGVVVVAANGDIVFANAAAEALARQNDGLQLNRRRHELSAMYPLEAKTLRGLIYAVTHGGAGGMLQITRRAQSSLAVLVAPLPTHLHPVSTGKSPFALVLITAPADSPILSEQTLQQLFALTAAEASVAVSLAAGRSAKEIAAARRVSLPTVRTQIRQILEKTGALHLRDLIRLLTGLPTVSAVLHESTRSNNGCEPQK